MAHFAKLNNDNEVIAISVVSDNDTSDSAGIEVESIGQQFLETIHGWDKDLWKQTSYNTYQGEHKLGGTPFRGNYAQKGMVYDATNNIFIEPQPYPSWTLNVSAAKWDPPVAKPFLQEGVYYTIEWNESNSRWEGYPAGEIVTPETQKYYWDSDNSSWQTI
jgi:hypothetical protein